MTTGTHPTHRPTAVTDPLVLVLIQALRQVRTLLRGELADLPPDSLDHRLRTIHLVEIEQAINQALGLPRGTPIEAPRSDSTFTCFDLSTGHLRREHLELLLEETSQDLALRHGLLVVAYRTYGSVWWIGSEHDNPELVENLRASGPDFEYLVRMVRRARTKGCAYIWFDADGQDVDELESFDHGAAPPTSQVA